MGYTANAQAGQTLEALQAVCEKMTGLSNVYQGKDGHTYFWTIGREREDGGISGAVYQCETDHLSPYRRAGYFEIKPDGGVKRNPRALDATLWVIERMKGVSA
jgi:hypothetical protein